MPEECAVMPPAISPRSISTALRHPSDASWNSAEAPITPPPITTASKVSLIGSAIERRATLPLGQVTGVVVPFRRLQRDVGRNDRLAERLLQDGRLFQRPQGVEQIERQGLGARCLVALGVHVDVEALAGVARVGDAV